MHHSRVRDEDLPQVSGSYVPEVPTALADNHNYEGNQKENIERNEERKDESLVSLLVDETKDSIALLEDKELI